MAEKEITKDGDMKQMKQAGHLFDRLRPRQSIRDARYYECAAEVIGKRVRFWIGGRNLVVF